jgi:hypothetical protein
MHEIKALGILMKFFKKIVAVVVFLVISSFMSFVTMVGALVHK